VAAWACRFYTLMVLSTALFDKPAFRNLICNGLVLAADGKKMSKRLQELPAARWRWWTTMGAVSASLRPTLHKFLQLPGCCRPYLEASLAPALALPLEADTPALQVFKPDTCSYPACCRVLRRPWPGPLPSPSQIPARSLVLRFPASPLPRSLPEASCCVSCLPPPAGCCVQDALRLYLINSPVVRARACGSSGRACRRSCADVFLPVVQTRTASWCRTCCACPARGSRPLPRCRWPSWPPRGTPWTSGSSPPPTSLVQFVRQEMEAYRLYTVRAPTRSHTRQGGRATKVRLRCRTCTQAPPALCAAPAPRGHGGLLDAGQGMSAAGPAPVLCMLPRGVPKLLRVCSAPQVVPKLLRFIDSLTNIYVRFNRKRLKGAPGRLTAPSRSPRSST